MFDPRKPAPTERPPTERAVRTRRPTPDTKRRRKSRPKPAQQDDDQLMDKAGVERLFKVLPPDLLDDEPARPRPQPATEAPATAEGERLVADKDAGPSVRKFFMEEAVVVDSPRQQARPQPPQVAPMTAVEELPSQPITVPAERAAVETYVQPQALPRRPLSRVEKRARGRVFFPTAAAVLTLISALLLYFIGRQQVEARARASVEKVSKEFIVAFTTFSDSSIGQQSDKVKELSVGGFREDYLSLVNDENYRKYLTDLKGNSSGKVLNLAIATMHPDQAKVIAFVDVTTVNRDRPEPQVVENRLELTLVKTPDGWKVDDVAFI